MNNNTLHHLFNQQPKLSVKRPQLRPGMTDAVTAALVASVEARREGNNRRLAALEASRRARRTKALDKISNSVAEAQNKTRQADLEQAAAELKKLNKEAKK